MTLLFKFYVDPMGINLHLELETQRFSRLELILVRTSVSILEKRFGYHPQRVTRGNRR